MDELKKKSVSTDMNDENAPENIINLKRLKDGYATIADKMGYGKFKPYLQRLFQSVEIMITQEETEFKKIDAKYQDMVRQCHIYEKTLSMLKDNNCCEMSSFSESSNTYALDDLTKVTPYLAPDLLQSTLGATNGAAGSTSIQFRLPRRRSSLSSRQFVSTPLGPTRTTKPSVPLAHFDDDSSFALQNSLGFQQQKQFVDAFTEPEPIPIIEQKDFSCQIIPLTKDQEIETTVFTMEYQSTQTDIITTETIACQINPTNNDCSIQTITNEQKDFSSQFMPTSIDQITETISTVYHTQNIQTDSISTNDYSCQITPEYIDQEIETNPILTEDIGLQSSLIDVRIFDNQEIQTDFISRIDVETQYEYDTPILPIIFSEEVPVSNEIEISIEKEEEKDEKIVFDQQCQTNISQSNECTQTPSVHFNDCASQSKIITYENQSIQTEFYSNLYSSSLYIVPTSVSQSSCSSTILFIPKENQSILIPNVIDQEIQCNLSSIETPIIPNIIDQETQCDLSPIEPTIIPNIIDQETQCDLSSIETTIIPIEIQNKIKATDRRSIIQYQLDEKEKQMNRIIEEYAALYGEFENERRRNMDLTEARDRLADHIKVLSDELGDREINQEKLLIKSCQQNKLINYMLPQIECSPMPKKKHHSASSFRRLLPKFK